MLLIKAVPVDNSLDREYLYYLLKGKQRFTQLFKTVSVINFEALRSKRSVWGK